MHTTSAPLRASSRDFVERSSALGGVFTQPAHRTPDYSIRAVPSPLGNCILLPQPMMPASPVYPEQTAMPYSTPFTRPAMPQARPHTVHSTVPDEMPPTAQDSIDDEDDQATPRASLANVSTLPERSLPRDDTATDLSLPPPSRPCAFPVTPSPFRTLPAHDPLIRSP